ncbi:hypothetical protein ACJIZ3_011729 [Penstemon smallii]|uniref:BHLH domain-containing protein n=1 Tax=Penstemon smallii TaxID=265156 RepID=A0ABD3UNG2_9LAMI
MEEQNCENALQFSTIPINWMANNASGLVDGFGAYQHYIMTQGRNEINQVPLVIPEWMQCQQTPQNYVEYLAESGYREIKEGMSYNMFSQVSNLELADPSQVEDYQRLHYEGNLIPVTGMEHQSSFQKEDCNQDYSNDSQGYTRSGADALKCSSKVHRRRSREKSYAADRCRRLRISQWLDALQELLPHQKEGCKEALLDNVIDNIKHLKSNTWRSLLFHIY